jgi:AcrR family transcriptional regulator
MALQTRPSGGRPAYDLYEHRYELYVRAAPVFRSFGYRQVTMKALAHACGVSAPALYHYFSSKLDFALFPLSSPPGGFCSTLLMRAADAHADPLRGLQAAFEAGVAQLEYVILAIRLALEIGRDERDAFSKRDLEAMEADLANVTLRCVPQLDRRRAHDLAHTLNSLVVTVAATNAEFSYEIFWCQAGAVVRGYLLDAGVTAERLDAAFGPASVTSAH